MEILYKNNIGICFCYKFSSMESLLFQLYCGSYFFAMLSLLADVQIY